MLHHTFEDTISMLPLLYISYLVIDYFERKDNNDDFLLNTLQKYGPLLGAILGIIPQCGFSIVASMLFLNRYITLGTLLSIFIATSDEALPVLLSNPSLHQTMISIIIIKVIVGILVGYLIDYIFFSKQTINSFTDLEEIEDEEKENSNNACPCCYVEYPIWLSALVRTLKIYGFIFIATFLLNIVIHHIGEENLGKYLLNNTIFQPVLAASFGLMPNCAASVVLTQLYTMNQVSFASLVSGLITNSGFGLLTLVRYQAKLDDLIRVLFYLIITAISTGIILHII